MKFKSTLLKLKTFLNTLFSQNKFLKVSFFITGIGSTIWFLYRFIQKPSRINYPCMQAAAPIMSSFLIWLSGFIVAFLSIKRFKVMWQKSKFAFAAVLLFVSLIAGAVMVGSVVFDGLANTAATPLVKTIDETRNDPVGDGYGIYNGRVVWVHDADATNENLTNTSGDYWWTEGNTDQQVISTMLNDGIKKLAGENTVADAWDALFTYHNVNKGRGKHGYQAGEKIFIKINLTNSCCRPDKYSSDQHVDSNPNLLFALVKQLVDSAGVAETDITLGDPFRTFGDLYWNLLHTAYPDITYTDNHAKGTSDGKGRVLTPLTTTDEYYTSDGNFSSPIPQAYKDASYFINMPVLKTHDAAGITIAAKNHQGSVVAPGQDATNQGMYPELHYCYPTNEAYYEMGSYRHIVDYMGNKYMGGNTVLYLVDAIFAAHNWDGTLFKWQIAPFNDDFTSSIFLSQDAVAIESVGFDFLFEEYLVSGETVDVQEKGMPFYKAVQDYIHQAASPDNWPTGITYDPEQDGTPIGSLGVHEHWNNVTDKQYSGNLGTPGGIHLVSVPSTLVTGSALTYPKDTAGYNTSVRNLISSIEELSLYPNPVKETINLKFYVSGKSDCRISVYNLRGQKMVDLFSGLITEGRHQLRYEMSEIDVPAGMYILNIETNDEGRVSRKSHKFQVL